MFKVNLPEVWLVNIAVEAEADSFDPRKPVSRPPMTLTYSFVNRLSNFLVKFTPANINICAFRCHAKRKNVDGVDDAKTKGQARDIAEKTNGIRIAVKSNVNPERKQEPSEIEMKMNVCRRGFAIVVASLPRLLSLSPPPAFFVREAIENWQLAKSGQAKKAKAKGP